MNTTQKWNSQKNTKFAKLLTVIMDVQRCNRAISPRSTKNIKIKPSRKIIEFKVLLSWLEAHKIGIMVYLDILMHKVCMN